MKTFRIFHCFWFGEKRALRKHGIKIKKVWGEESTHLLAIPESMLRKRNGAYGEVMYVIYSKRGDFLGTIKSNLGKWLFTYSPGYDLYNCF